MQNPNTAQYSSTYSATQYPQSIVYLGLFIWPQEKQFCFLGRLVKLPPRLFITMHELMKKPEVFHTRDELCEQLNPNLYDRSIDIRVKRLRTCLRQSHACGDRVIVTKRGVGYRLWQRSDFES